MGQMSEVDIEIKNSKALSYLWHEISRLREMRGASIEHHEKIALMKAESDRMRAENKARELDIKEKDLEIKDRSVSLMEIELERYRENRQQQETSEMIHIVDLQDRLAIQESEMRILVHQVTEITEQVKELMKTLEEVES